MSRNLRAIIDQLYERYGVDKAFYSAKEEDEIIKTMKGILAELDIKKQKPYTMEDIDLIKDIYRLYC